MRKKLIDTAEATEDNSDETAKLAKELSEAEKRADKLEKELSGLNREMSQNAESAKKFTQSTKQNFESAKSSSISLGAVMSGLKISFDAFAGGVKAVAAGIKVAFDTTAAAVKATITTTAAATAAVTTYAKAAYTAYSEYQQLIGGVDTLFKANSENIQEYAAEAYQTAGMSANRYLDQVVKFSASLIQGLEGDTQSAAAIANVAIQDMSDNVSKFGSELSSIENAYQGFSKKNFTLLDNLRLGYGGTQAEMARLINDAGVYGMTVDEKSVANVPLHTIIQSIHVIQEKLGVTGTTAKEAGHTIAGSVGSMAAAWENLTAEVSKPNGNIADRFSDFISAAKVAERNVIPTIKNTFAGIRKLLKEGIPVIAEEIPKLIAEVLPTAIYSGTSFVRSLSEIAETLIPTLAEVLEKEAYSSSKAFGGLISAIVKAVGISLPSFARSLKSGLKGLIEGLDFKEIAKVVTNAFSIAPELLSMFTTAIPDLLSELGSILKESGNLTIVSTSIIEMLKAVLDVAIGVVPTVLPFAVEVLKTLISELANHVPTLIPQITELILVIADTMTRPDVRIPLLAAGETLLFALVDGFVDSAPLIAARLPSLVGQLSLTLVSESQVMTEAGATLANYTIQGIFDFVEPIRAAGNFIVSETAIGIGEFFGKIWEKGKELLFEFLDGVHAAVFSIATTVTEIYTEFSNKFSEQAPWAKTWGTDLIDNFVQGIKDNLYKVVGAVSGVAGIVHEYLHFSQPDKGPLADFGTYAPDMVDLFVKGIDDNQSKLIDSVRGMAANVRNSFGFESPMFSPAVAGIRALAPSASAAAPIVININNSFDISGVTNVNDLDFDDLSGRATEQIADKLKQLGIVNNRAVGSPGWV